MPEHDARTTRRRTLIGIGLVAVLAAVLIAIVIVRSTGQKILNENSDTLVLVGKGAEDGTDTTRGELTDVHGCLGLTDAGDETVIIWPHGTTIETPEPLRIRVGGTVYEVGETMEIKGKPGSIEPSDYFYDNVSKQCRAEDVFVAD
jgi:hypothetical protein